MHPISGYRLLRTIFRNSFSTHRKTFQAFGGKEQALKPDAGS